MKGKGNKKVTKGNVAKICLKDQHKLALATDITLKMKEWEMRIHKLDFKLLDMFDNDDVLTYL